MTKKKKMNLSPYYKEYIAFNGAVLACQLIIDVCIYQAGIDDEMKRFVDDIKLVKEYLESFKYTCPYVFKDHNMLNIINNGIKEFNNIKTSNDDEKMMVNIILGSLNIIFEFLFDHMLIEFNVENMKLLME